MHTPFPWTGYTRTHLFWVLPPSLPLVCVVGCDGQVANSGIKPDIEYLEGQEEGERLG